MIIPLHNFLIREAAAMRFFLAYLCGLTRFLQDFQVQEGLA
jgi:hypothetical protein